jgi:transposase
MGTSTPIDAATLNGRGDAWRILNGPIWLARMGRQWSQLPRRFCPKSSAHARLQEWVADEVIARAWEQVLAVFETRVGLDREWQAGDGCLIKAPGERRASGAAQATGANLADRANGVPITSSVDRQVGRALGVCARGGQLH